MMGGCDHIDGGMKDVWRAGGLEDGGSVGVECMESVEVQC